MVRSLPATKKLFPEVLSICCVFKIYKFSLKCNFLFNYDLAIYNFTIRNDFSYKWSSNSSALKPLPLHEHKLKLQNTAHIKG